MSSEQASINKMLADCWQLMERHGPEDTAAVKMKTITALCDEIRRLKPTFAIGEKVRVLAFEGEFEGVVVSRSEHKNIGDQYAVFAAYPHNKRAEAEWFPEDQLYKLGAGG